MDDRELVLEGIRQGLVSQEEAAALLKHWPLWRRPNQCPPRDWSWGWMVKAGRGYGKTRVGAEETWQAARDGVKRIHLVGRTAADVRDTMVQGESGIIACARPGERAVYVKSERKVTLEPYGTLCLCFEDAAWESLRGPQCEFAWLDELGAWRYGDQTFAMMEMGLRLGDRPRWVGTTTPRQTPIMKELRARENVVVTTGTTYENAANLAPSFLSTLKARYEGTALGRQELEALDLDVVEGALWKFDLIDPYRVDAIEVPPLRRIIVALDPTVTTGPDADECGVVVVGICHSGHLYVLHDGSGQLAPHEWARRAVGLWRKHKADRIVGESNNGGELIELTLRGIAEHAPIKLVHASRGKSTRAEPVVALYERGFVHHVGAFAELESEQTTWVPGMRRNGKEWSPGRLDALVWACYDLALGSPVGTWADVKPPSKPHAPARSAVRF